MPQELSDGRRQSGVEMNIAKTKSDGCGQHTDQRETNADIENDEGYVYLK